jgi:hypothetical protein
MQHNKYIQILIIVLFVAQLQMVKSQQVNTTYFMENLPLRHMMNPAFQPETNYYISLPVIGSVNAAIGNNSLSMQDVVYKQNGKTISFLDENADVNTFYNKLQSQIMLNGGAQVNLLSVGFKHDYSFWNFSLTQRLDAFAGVPKDFFKLALFGTTDIFNNNFNMSRLQASVNYYTEAALGYSRQLDEQWTVGMKIKYLYGTLNISNTNDYITLDAGLEKWQLRVKGTTNFAGELQPFQDLANQAAISVRKPSGAGAGIDLGVQLRLTSNLYLSASLTDLGYIRWTKNLNNLNYSADFKYDGIAHVDVNTGLPTLNALVNNIANPNYFIDSLSTALTNSVAINQTNNTYTTTTTAKLNIGAEYKFLSNKLSVGLLLRQLYYTNYVHDEITASVNAFPTDWFNASLSYSVLKGFNTFGAGFGVRTGIVHWFAAMDYVPLTKTNLNSLSIYGMSFKNIPVPYNLKNFNLSLGINIVFDNILKNKSNPTEKSGRQVNSKTGLFRTKFPTEENCNCPK